MYLKLSFYNLKKNPFDALYESQIFDLEAFKKEIQKIDALIWTKNIILMIYHIFFR